MHHQHLLLTELDIHDSPVPIIKSVLPNIFDPQSSPHQLEICSTCNFTGFVVAYAFAHNAWETKHPYHLFNPVTAQHIVVQQNQNIVIQPRDCALVFATKTNQLKLLKFVYGRIYVDIQTIGTCLWRTAETQRACRPARMSGFPVFLNGAYHWFCFLISGWSKSWAIGIFNADDEVFNEFLTPSSIGDYAHSNIGLLDDCLCICMMEKTCEFWIMNKYGVPESWTKKFVISNNILKGLRPCQIFEPLRYLGNGEILILCHDNNVISYNLNTKRCKIIKKYYGNRLRYEAIPYVPCFSKIRGLNGEIL